MTDAGAHRPWPRPDRPWTMAQRWHDLLFLHWPIQPNVLAPFLPPGLPLDTFDGAAWLGVVPFRMSGIRLRRLPPVPFTSAFPELNVRTYVTLGDKPGVWFFSLDAHNALAVAVARRWFSLPYFRARMACRADGEGGVVYESERTHKGARPAVWRGRYRPTGPVALAEPGTLEHWLTERYCLYALKKDGRFFRGEIHHDPWPLQPAEFEVETDTMTPIPRPQTPALLAHFARDLSVRVWSPEPTKTR